MGTAILAERIELLEGTLNIEARTVEAVLIRPGWSANGRYYSREALAKAAAKFEGAKAYANHPTPRQLKEGEGRDVRDLTGQYTNVRIGEAGELRATRKVFDTPSGNAIWPLIVESVGSAHPPIGVSINALGKGSKGKADGREGLIVESIDIVNSADDVDNPAAGGGFERLIADTGPTLIADLLQLASYEEITEARPDVVASIQKQNKRVRQTEEARALAEERDAAQTALETTQRELAEAQAELAAARAEKARLALVQEVDAAFAQCNFKKTYESLLRNQLAQLPTDQWLPFLAVEAQKAHVSQLGQAKVAVHGMPLREAAQVSTTTPKQGPIDPTGKTPKQLMREIRERQQAKGN